jgi:hypothetical protein
MKMPSSEKQTLFGQLLLVFIAPFVVLFLLNQVNIRITKREYNKWKKEKLIQFEGVVSDYKTDIRKEESSFLLNDSIRIIIPRSYKEVIVGNGDTIIKKEGHSYIVKYWLYEDAKRHTYKFTFDNPYK